jgi:hypothetical protein
MRTIAFVILTAACSGFAQDAALFDIIAPPTVMDSNTAFVPVVVVKNNGSQLLSNIPLSFSIMRLSDPSDTFYSGTANSGPIGAGIELEVEFPDSGFTPDPDYFAMTSIAALPGDTNPRNDTLTLPLYVRYVDVATEIVSPRDTEVPGLIAVRVRLTNNGNLPALVSRLDVRITSFYYSDNRENIMIGVGENQVVTWVPWSYTGGTETCTAWITYPADMNPSNDTDVVIINAAGIEDWTEMGLDAGMSFGLSPSPLAGNVLHIEYSLTQAGPASVTLFDISGRPVAKRDFVADRAGKVSLDLRRLGGGVYFVRLEDGQRNVVQKIVVQR